MTVFRLRKFTPELPIIYPAAGVQIGEVEAAQPVLTFYYFLAARKRDLENVAEECAAEKRAVRPDEVAFLARRLERTLSPGACALHELGRSISDAQEIERSAMAVRDEFAAAEGSPRANAGRGIRDRIRLLQPDTASPS